MLLPGKQVLGVAQSRLLAFPLRVTWIRQGASAYTNGALVKLIVSASFVQRLNSCFAISPNFINSAYVERL